MKSICIVSPGYPYGPHSFFPFVKNVADEFCLQGLNVYVIAPQSITKCVFRGTHRHPRRWEYSVGDSKIIVIQPYYITIGNFFKRTSRFLYKNAVICSLRSIKAKIDVFYCHFWSSSLSVIDFAQENRIPIFVASGESTVSMEEPLKVKKRLKEYVSGVVCVSTKNKEESINCGITTNEKCIVLPNAIDPGLFKPRDKRKLREQHSIPPSLFIICFVGWFNNRKGSKRVSDAITRCNSDVYSFFIGSSMGDDDCVPVCDKILFLGSVEHDSIPLYLNMADVFVLPTLHEGCCNAIVEAMACGLPIISSDLPFNKDILNDSNSLLVDPNNVEEISKAILVLKNDSHLRNELSHGALCTAKTLSISSRVKSILSFIELSLQTNNRD